MSFSLTLEFPERVGIGIVDQSFRVTIVAFRVVVFGLKQIVLA